MAEQQHHRRMAGEVLRRRGANSSKAPAGVLRRQSALQVILSFDSGEVGSSRFSKRVVPLGKPVLPYLGAIATGYCVVVVTTMALLGYTDSLKED